MRVGHEYVADRWLVVVETSRFHSSTEEPSTDQTGRNARCRRRRHSCGTPQNFSPQNRESVAIFDSQEVIPHVRCSRNSLDGSNGIYRIHSDRPGASSGQYPLNYRSLPRSVNRISPCHHVHSSRETATKACLRCALYCTNVPGVGYIPRRPRLTSEAKALIPHRHAEFGLIVPTVRRTDLS